jgi:hypothetical protein
MAGVECRADILQVGGRVYERIQDHNALRFRILTLARPFS